MKILSILLLCGIIVSTQGDDVNTCFTITKLHATDPLFNLAEGPVWIQRSQKLYFVDIFAGTYHAYDNILSKVTTVTTNCKFVSFIVPVKDLKHHYVVGCDLDIVLIKWDGKQDQTGAKVKTLASLSSDHKGMRLNDAKVDSRGRLWAGTMDIDPYAENAKKGALYRIGADLKPVKMLDNILLSNGIAWNEGNDRMYYADSLAGTVQQFEFNEDTGDISNGTVLFDLKTYNLTGIPDGMTVDRQGNLLVANFGGGRVLHINHVTGKLMCAFKFDETVISSVTFGGIILDILYVTTGKRTLSPQQLAEQHHAGSIYAVHAFPLIGRFPHSFILNKTNS